MSRKGPALFTCKRHAGELRLSKAFCGESWRRAREVWDPIDRVRLGPCVGCKTGQRNGDTGAPVTITPKRAMWSIK